jgi:hypothetical protein
MVMATGPPRYAADNNPQQATTPLPIDRQRLEHIYADQFCQRGCHLNLASMLAMMMRRASTVPQQD